MSQQVNRKLVTFNYNKNKKQKCFKNVMELMNTFSYVNICLVLKQRIQFESDHNLSNKEGMMSN